MKLYVEPMDSTVVDAAPDGRVQLDDGEWISPTFQERRAVIHAAENELAALRELLEFLGGLLMGHLQVRERLRPGHVWRRRAANVWRIREMVRPARQ